MTELDDTDAVPAVEVLQARPPGRSTMPQETPASIGPSSRSLITAQCPRAQAPYRA